MSEQEFDAIVIGAGSTGEVAAGRLSEQGASVAIVESHLVGGECTYYACMPSKALLRPAELLAEVERVPGAKEAISGSVDAEATLKRRDQIVSDLDDEGQLPWLEERGIALFRGEATLTGERTVEVGGDTLTASKAVLIATGTAASLPPIDGLEEAEPWTNREGTTSSEVPESLIVLGGGPVGAELSQAWASLGAEVTLVETEERLLAKEEPFAGEQVAAGLRERFGVTVRTGARAESVTRSEGRIELTLAGGETIGAAQLLVAAGRIPRTGGLGLESVGLEPDGFLEVDDQLRVKGFDWLYAIGDVNGRALLTHMGKYQGRLAADHISGRDVAAIAEGLGPPRVTFTDPQVAAAGLTLAQAEERKINARAVDVETSANAGASFIGRNAEGTCRLVIDEDRGVIVGATFTGPETADLLHAATVAIVAEVPLEKLWHAVPSFPTRTEIWLKLMEKYGL